MLGRILLIENESQNILYMTSSQSQRYS